MLPDIYLICNILLREMNSVSLSLDAEKTFDRIHYGFMECFLIQCGLEGPVLKAILLLYTNIWITNKKWYKAGLSVILIHFQRNIGY